MNPTPSHRTGTVLAPPSLRITAKGDQQQGQPTDAGPHPMPSQQEVTQTDPDYTAGCHDNPLESGPLVHAGQPIQDRHQAARASFVEDVEWMAATGETIPGAAARLHIHPDGLRKRLTAADRRDLLALLLANQDDRPYAGPHGVLPPITPGGRHEPRH